MAFSQLRAKAKARAKTDAPLFVPDDDGTRRSAVKSSARSSRHRAPYNAFETDSNHAPTIVGDSSDAGDDTHVTEIDHDGDDTHVKTEIDDAGDDTHVKTEIDHDAGDDTQVKTEIDHDDGDDNFEPGYWDDINPEYDGEDNFDPVYAGDDVDAGDDNTCEQTVS
jgi:hypothetical protein